MTTYTFSKDIGPDEWKALPRAFKQGESVEKFTGHTYGLDRDDLVYLGVETVMCKHPDFGWSFTVPVSALVTEDGDQPMCEYVKLPLSQ